MNKKSFKIATRNSPLALKQAQMVMTALSDQHPDLEIELVPIRSQADWNKADGEKPLSEEAGGKGLFAKEIEKLILEGAVDCGVHSLKDMAAFLPDGLVIQHVLPRANPYDVCVSGKYKSIDALPDGAIVGSCSARRTAIALSKRRDLKIVPFRGNVQTRIDKVKSGQVDATFLAQAGLARLGIRDDILHPLTSEEMLPACGQGIICIETRNNDAYAHEILQSIHCVQTGICAAAERAVLASLNGSCHTPIAAFSTLEGNQLYLQAQVYALDGSSVYEQSATAPCANDGDAYKVGQQVGEALNAVLPEGMLS